MTSRMVKSLLLLFSLLMMVQKDLQMLQRNALITDGDWAFTMMIILSAFQHVHKRLPADRVSLKEWSPLKLQRIFLHI